MAGHSQFKNITHRKGRQDAVKSKLYADPQFATWPQFLDRVADATEKRFRQLKKEVRDNKEMRDRVELEGLKTQREQKPQPSDLSIKF